jgi:hypothetical protein
MSGSQCTVLLVTELLTEEFQSSFKQHFRNFVLSLLQDEHVAL